MRLRPPPNTPLIPELHQWLKELHYLIHNLEGDNTASDFTLPKQAIDAGGGAMLPSLQDTDALYMPLTSANEYAKYAGNGTFTGTNTHTGTEVFSGVFSVTETVAGGHFSVGGVGGLTDTLSFQGVYDGVGTYTYTMTFSSGLFTGVSTSV